MCFQAAALWLTTGSSNQQCGCYLPFPLVTSSPCLSLHNRDIKITLPTSGLEVNPIFQSSLSLSPYGSFPRGYSCLSPKFTSVHAWRGSGIHRKPFLLLTLPHTSPPRTHFSVPLTDCSLMSETTHTKNGTWLKKHVKTLLASLCHCVVASQLHHS